MAADQYLKSAAGQLQSAAQAIKMDIDKLRSDAKSTEQQMQRDIDKNDQEIRALTGRTLAPNEKIEKTHLVSRIQTLKSDNDTKKQQLQQTQSSIGSAVSAKEGAMNDVMNDARSLEGKAGNPALR